MPEWEVIYRAVADFGDLTRASAKALAELQALKKAAEDANAAQVKTGPQVLAAREADIKAIREERTAMEAGIGSAQRYNQWVNWQGAQTDTQYLANLQREEQLRHLLNIQKQRGFYSPYQDYAYRNQELAQRYLLNRAENQGYATPEQYLSYLATLRHSMESENQAWRDRIAVLSAVTLAQVEHANKLAGTHDSAAQLLAGTRGAQEALRTLGSQSVSPGVSLDDTQFQADLASDSQALTDFGNLSVAPRAWLEDEALRRSVAADRQRLTLLGKMVANPVVEIDNAQALTAIEEVVAAMSRLRAEQAHVEVSAKPPGVTESTAPMTGGAQAGPSPPSLSDALRRAFGGEPLMEKLSSEVTTKVVADDARFRTDLATDTRLADDLGHPRTTQFYANVLPLLAGMEEARRAAETVSSPVRVTAIPGSGPAPSRGLPRIGFSSDAQQAAAEAAAEGQVAQAADRAAMSAKQLAKADADAAAAAKLHAREENDLAQAELYRALAADKAVKADNIQQRLASLAAARAQAAAEADLAGQEAKAAGVADFLASRQRDAAAAAILLAGAQDKAAAAIARNDALYASQAILKLGQAESMAEAGAYQAAKAFQEASAAADGSAASMDRATAAAVTLDAALARLGDAQAADARVLADAESHWAGLGLNMQAAGKAAADSDPRFAGLEGTLAQVAVQAAAADAQMRMTQDAMRAGEVSAHGLWSSLGMLAAQEAAVNAIQAPYARLAREAADATEKVGTAAGGAGNRVRILGTGFAFANPQIRLFAGLLGTGGILTISAISLAVHSLIDFLIVLVPAVVTAAAGLAAFGLAASDSAKQIYNHFTQLHTVSDALNITIAPLTGNLEHMHDVVRPQVFQLLGDTLGAAGKQTAVFNQLAVSTGALLDNWGVRAEALANRSGPALHGFLKTGAYDLQQFGIIGQSIASVFVNLLQAGEKTRVAETLLTGVADAFHLVAVAADAIPQPVLVAGIAFFSILHYGGALYTLFSNLTSGMLAFASRVPVLNSAATGLAGTLGATSEQLAVMASRDKGVRAVSDALGLATPQVVTFSSKMEGLGKTIEEQARVIPGGTEALARYGTTLGEAGQKAVLVGTALLAAEPELDKIAGKFGGVAGGAEKAAVKAEETATRTGGAWSKVGGMLAGLGGVFGGFGRSAESAAVKAEEGAARTGGAWSKLTGVFSRIGNLFSGVGSGAGKAATETESAAVRSSGAWSKFGGTILGFASKAWPLLAIAGAVALGIIIDKLLTARSAAQQWGDALNKAILNAPTVATGATKLFQGFGQTIQQAASAQAEFNNNQRNSGQVIAKNAALFQNYQSSLDHGRASVDATALATTKFASSQGQLTDSQKSYHDFLTHTLSPELNSLTVFTGTLASKFGVDFTGAMNLASVAGVKFSSIVAGPQSAAFQQAILQVTSLVAGYQAMGQQIGIVGSDMNVLSLTTSDQATSMQNLNKAWDAFAKAVSAPVDTFLTWTNNMMAFSQDALAAGAAMQGLGTNVTTVGGLSQASAAQLKGLQQQAATLQQIKNPTAAQQSDLKSLQAQIKAVQATTQQAAPQISNSAIKLQQDFQATFSSTEQMFDAFRTAQSLNGGKGSFVGFVKDAVAALIPLAGHNKAAAAEISTLAQEAGGPATTSLQSLTKWAGHVKDPMLAMYNAMQQATIATGNLSADAAKLASSLQQDLGSLVKTSIEAKLITPAMDAATKAIHDHGAGSKQAASAEKNLYQVIAQVTGSSQEAASVVSLLTGAVSGNARVASTQGVPATKALHDALHNAKAPSDAMKASLDGIAAAQLIYGKGSPQYEAAVKRATDKLSGLGVEQSNAAKIIHGVTTKTLPAATQSLEDWAGSKKGLGFAAVNAAALTGAVEKKLGPSLDNLGNLALPKNRAAFLTWAGPQGLGLSKDAADKLWKKVLDLQASLSNIKSPPAISIKVNWDVQPPPPILKAGSTTLQLVSSGPNGPVYKPVHHAAGGQVGGTGEGDVVPAMLTPGEYVIRKMAAAALKAKHGHGVLDQLNYADKAPVTVLSGQQDTASAQQHAAGGPVAVPAAHLMAFGGAVVPYAAGGPVAAPAAHLMVPSAGAATSPGDISAGTSHWDKMWKDVGSGFDKHVKAGTSKFLASEVPSLLAGTGKEWATTWTKASADYSRQVADPIGKFHQATIPAYLAGTGKHWLGTWNKAQHDHINQVETPFHQFYGATVPGYFTDTGKRWLGTWNKAQHDHIDQVETPFHQFYGATIPSYLTDTGKRWLGTWNRAQHDHTDQIESPFHQFYGSTIPSYLTDTGKRWLGTWNKAQHDHTAQIETPLHQFYGSTIPGYLSDTGKRWLSTWNKAQHDHTAQIEDPFHQFYGATIPGYLTQTGTRWKGTWTQGHTDFATIIQSPLHAWFTGPLPQAINQGMRAGMNAAIGHVINPTVSFINNNILKNLPGGLSVHTVPGVAAGGIPYGAGSVPGVGEQDTHLARLMPGEYVVRKPARMALEAKFGRGYMDHLNQADTLLGSGSRGTLASQAHPGFASGGPVPDSVRNAPEHPSWYAAGGCASGGCMTGGCQHAAGGPAACACGGSCGVSAKAAGGSAGWGDPLRADRYSTGRIDQGIDFNGSGIIYALGPGTITKASSNSGWPGGGDIIEQVQGANWPGGLWFVAEQVTPRVGVGAHVTSNTIIADWHPGGTGIEMGFAAPGSSGQTLAWVSGQSCYTGDPGCHPTAYGRDAANLMASLRGKAGSGSPIALGGAAPGSPGGGGGNFVVVQTLGEIEGLVTGGGSAGIGSPGNVSSGSSSQNLVTIARFLMTQGASAAGAAGIAGTIAGESGGNPESVGSGGFGLIGWTGNTIGLPAGFNGPTGNASSDLAIEMRGIVGYARARSGGWPGSFATATDPVQAGNVWSAYEAPKHALSDTRPGIAQQVFASLGGHNAAPAAAGSTASGATGEVLTAKGKALAAVYPGGAKALLKVADGGVKGIFSTIWDHAVQPRLGKLPGDVIPGGILRAGMDHAGTGMIGFMANQDAKARAIQAQQQAANAAGSAAPAGGGGVAPSNSSEAAWISALLSALGDPHSAANVTSISSWIRHETPWPPVASNNPLNTTQNEPGATSFNSVGVKNYPNAAEGAQATVATLNNGRYGDVLGALKTGGGLCGRSFSGLSTWSGGGYSSVCAAGGSVGDCGCGSSASVAALASGGHVAGGGGPTADDVPAWLSTGEWVINAGAVSRLEQDYGPGVMDAINGYDSGGSVPSGGILGSSVAGGAFAGSSPGMGLAVPFATGGPVISWPESVTNAKRAQASTYNMYNHLIRDKGVPASLLSGLKAAQTAESSLFVKLLNPDTVLPVNFTNLTHDLGSTYASLIAHGAWPASAKKDAATMRADLSNEIPVIQAMYNAWVRSQSTYPRPEAVLAWREAVYKSEQAQLAELARFRQLEAYFPHPKARAAAPASGGGTSGGGSHAGGITMFDSADPRLIPSSAPMVAGYISGGPGGNWTSSQWARWRGKPEVQIVQRPGIYNRGDVLDVEPGAAGLGDVRPFVTTRKRQGYNRPSVYASSSVIPSVKRALSGMTATRDYDLWAAHWTGSPHRDDVAAAVQYANKGPYDLSVVWDPGWPHRARGGPVGMASGGRVGMASGGSWQSVLAGMQETSQKSWGPMQGDPLKIPASQFGKLSSALRREDSYLGSAATAVARRTLGGQVNNLRSAIRSEEHTLGPLQSTWLKAYGPHGLANPASFPATPGPAGGISTVSQFTEPSPQLPLPLGPPGVFDVSPRLARGGPARRSPLLSRLSVLPPSARAALPSFAPDADRGRKHHGEAHDCDGASVTAVNAPSVTIGDINVYNPVPEKASTSIHHEAYRVAFLAGRGLALWRTPPRNSGSGRAIP